MMDPEHKTEREITYKVGWKRGKIKMNQSNNTMNEQPNEAAVTSFPTGAVWHLWNERWLWREARVLPGSVLRAMLYVFPVITFGISLWLVYRLSFQP